MTETPSPPVWRLHGYQHCGHTVMALGGEIDLSSLKVLMPRLEEATEPPDPRLVIDLSGATFLDASGLRLLSFAYRRTQGADGHLHVVSPNPRISRVIRYGGLTSAIPPVPTLGNALAACGAQPCRSGG